MVCEGVYKCRFIVENIYFLFYLLKFGDDLYRGICDLSRKRVLKYLEFRLYRIF